MSFTAGDSATKISAGNAITPEDIIAAGAKAPEDVATYAMYLGDDALMLAQRLGHWISRAPEMEEDVALANIAQDQLGHARFLLSYAGSAWDQTEDDLAYFRTEEQFRSCRLVEQENGDFGQTIARQLIFSLYQYELFTRLMDSADETLASVAAKAVKEVTYHVDHAAQWTLRLGDGTDESHRRMQEGLYYMWPYVDELFNDDDLLRDLSERGIAVLPSTLRESFDARIEPILEQATLTVPDVPGAWGGDRSGNFSEHRGHILAEMQVLARQFPQGVTW
ncbi:MAG: phenylacetate-CoA oxygenase subunit PaaC [Yaniella sp.]|uniref:1,2-phenylacetyl-CoA epoxidase subunit PaaC n=1 Tax=Yaniella sp. TaxID=2773929 RepID=UPI001832CAD8|nr:1,2-phenylacetyl-CoA epoxidase subunit PaaC [Yaniella sp.]NLZ98727.1 phenylacetate-CoA oxygenase subunit PaaC [Micrococcus sp.]MDN5704298.1 phenylacetate-CoA oxygenase subunit PaaC [Yaniella sp.]MDN5731252.1 phenylacetate-CoA oxygenase subunit PaaC [Yaniella sp.]MDN5742048.1 phenylacetate-CoA oxygenase subunit PaaC [Yaniella sp.]MDN5814795.1 phenylacetate-CoA oxygenase subunit PaaC [Yaniella sp.]